MLRIRNVRSAIVAGVLSLATPACDASYKANCVVGANHARAQAGEIVRKCQIPGKPVSRCLKESGVSVSDACAILTGAANYRCGEVFTKIRYTGLLDEMTTLRNLETGSQPISKK